MAPDSEYRRANHAEETLEAIAEWAKKDIYWDSSTAEGSHQREGFKIAQEEVLRLLNKGTDSA